MKNMTFYDQNIEFFDHIGIPESSNLHGKKVAIILSEDLQNNENAQNTFLLCVNLLVRLFTRIDIIIPHSTISVGSISKGLYLAEIAYEIAYSIYDGEFKILETEDLNADYDGRIIIGCGIPSDNQTVYCSSDGWNVNLNYTDTVTENINPIGACAAACFGVAEIFKLISKVPGMREIKRLIFSMLNYSTQIPGCNPAIDLVDLKDITLIGAGAIGSGFIYTLNLFNKIIGKLDIVDGDYYTEGNLHRYILSNKKILGQYKAQYAKNYLSGQKGLSVEAHQVVYTKYVEEHKRIDTLISAVDKRETRHYLQGDLHRLIIDGATSDSCVDIARVEFGNGGACLGCIYKPMANDEVQLITMAENLGLSIDKVKCYYYTNEGISAEDIEIVSKKLGDKSEFIGQPIDSLYKHGYCGSSKFQTNESNETIVAPISFISAMAGVLVASELIKDRTIPDYVLQNHFYIDTFKMPNPMFHKVRKADKNCCYCSDQIYVDAYKEKWGLQ